MRRIVLAAHPQIEENIKWNGPNYAVGEQDRITIRVQPPKHLQIIFHCGVKTQKEPEEKLPGTDYSWLQWKTNDRAVATFKDTASFEQSQQQLATLVKNWLDVTL